MGARYRSEEIKEYWSDKVYRFPLTAANVPAGESLSMRLQDIDASINNIEVVAE